MRGPLKVFIVEDNDSFRQALELLFALRDDVEVVGSLGDGAQAPASCLEVGPDVEFRSAGVAVTLTKDEHLESIVAALHQAAGRVAA